MVEGNVKKYYLFSFLYNMYLWLPIWVLFLLDKGLTLTLITLLDVFFFVTMVVLSIPVGILSDRIGRKKTLSWGALFTGVALYLFAISETFSQVALSYIFWAGALTFITVGGTTFLYDTLKTLSRESEFTKINGRSIFFATGSMAIASLVGGRIGEQSLQLPILISAGFCLLSFVLTFSFEEPLVSKAKTSYLGHLKESVSLVRRSPPLLFLMVFGVCASLFISISQVFSQPYFRLLGVSITSIGVIYFVFKIFVAASASSAHIIEGKLGESRTLLLIPACLFLCMAALARNVGVIPAYLFVNVMAGFSQPILHNYMNRQIPTPMRATVMSLYFGLLASVQLFMEPAMGYVADRVSLQASFAIMGALCLSFLCFAILKRSLFVARETQKS